MNQENHTIQYDNTEIRGSAVYYYEMLYCVEIKHRGQAWNMNLFRIYSRMQNVSKTGTHGLYCKSIEFVVSWSHAFRTNQIWHPRCAEI